MANLDLEPEQAPHLTPLLASSSNSNQNRIEVDEAQEENEEEVRLDQTFRRLEIFISILGFRQCSMFNFALPCSAFMAVGVVIPFLALHFSECSHCEKYQIRYFEMDVVALQACLAAVSLACLSYNLRKYGLRRFLFVDRHSGQIANFHKDYVKQISVS